ncbi:hypothetical protein [Nostoc sp.]|uniref:hypothetical protein n=1 Tax=Nostoc sp. TaxID=1180 RepID=UPI002FFCC2CB
MAQNRPPRRRHTWLSILSSVTSLRRDQWLRLLALMLVTVLGTLFILMSLLFISTRFFGLRILAGQIFLDPNYQSLGAHVTVDATAGFQNSGIFLKTGQKISLFPEGRIHLASEQIYDFAKSVKPLIVNDKELANRWSAQIKQRYQSKPSDKNVFYRDWVGPEGDSEASDILEDCKLQKDMPWGRLLAIIIPGKDFSKIPKDFTQSDPFEVLNDNQLKSSQLFSVTNNTEFTADQDGWLTFIVNEAVISQYSPSENAKDYYKALQRAYPDLSDGRKKMHLGSLPLVFFSDNAGAFRITVRY